MVAAVDWANLTVAAGFILGAILGTVATIAVMRTLVSWFRRDRD